MILELSLAELRVGVFSSPSFAPASVQLACLQCLVSGDSALLKQCGHVYPWNTAEEHSVWQRMLHRQDTHSRPWMPLGRGATCSVLADLHDCGGVGLFSLSAGLGCTELCLNNGFFARACVAALGCLLLQFIPSI